MTGTTATFESTMTSATATTTACGAGAGAVDQEQLSPNGDIGLASNCFGRTFVVGTTGIHTGIEFGLAACSASDQGASVVVTVTSGGTTLGTTGRTVSKIRTAVLSCS